MHAGYTVKIQVKKKKEIIIKGILLSYPYSKGKETIVNTTYMYNNTMVMSYIKGTDR